jgi:hypothetical protein
LEASGLRLAYFCQYGDLARPVGQFRGSEPGVGEFHGGEGFAVLALGLGDVVHPDPCDLGLVEDGLEFVAEEHADLALVAEVAPEVGEERVADDEVELGSGDESCGVGEECVPGADGFGAEVEVLLEGADVIGGHVESPDDALEGFGEVALIVLGLDDPDAERPHRRDAEEVLAECPADDDLHHQG